ncbi:MAG: hypothetical protein JSV26_02985 [bacterium]|nr:MAG: hypothetical protein JSV26_02985 [bacterium]
MVWFLYAVSFVWIALGSAVILDTERVRDLGENLEEDLNPKVVGGSLAGFGVLLAISSFWSGVVWFLFLVGLIIVGIGAMLLLGDEEKGRKTISAWIGISDRGLKLWGLIFVITGVAILAWI